MLNFDFLEKGLDHILSFDFSRKMSDILYSINWLNFIVRLPIDFTSWNIGKFVC